MRLLSIEIEGAERESLEDGDAGVGGSPDLLISSVMMLWLEEATEQG